MSVLTTLNQHSSACVSHGNRQKRHLELETVPSTVTERTPGQNIAKCTEDLYAELYFKHPDERNQRRCN